MRPLKQPKSYDDQIKGLINDHGLIVNDYVKAKDILSSVNYYRLSAYGIGLRQREDKERYIQGISLDHIYRLYKFDSRLRSILIPAIESIEIELRTRIAYCLAMKYGAEGYMNPSNFVLKRNKHGISIHYDVVEKFENEKKRQDKLPCVKHHNNTYGGHFPIWAAVELFTFGMLSSLYSVMKVEDKKEIAKQYKISADHFESWLLALVEVRNICAHYGRIYNMPLKQSPYMFKEYVQYKTKITKIFPSFIVIRHLLKGTSVWNTLYAELIALMEEYADVVKLSFMGFPENWCEVFREG